TQTGSPSTGHTHTSTTCTPCLLWLRIAGPATYSVHRPRCRSRAPRLSSSLVGATKRYTATFCAERPRGRRRAASRYTLTPSSLRDTFAFQLRQVRVPAWSRSHSAAHGCDAAMDARRAGLRLGSAVDRKS